MLFEKLLFTPCLLPGVTRFKESKVSIEIKTQADETILFFCIDNNSKGHSNCKGCTLRDYLWKGQQNQCICDLLVFYAKADRRVLCFVELKDNKSDFHHGTEQLINTYKVISPHLRLHNNYIVQAFIIGYHGSPPEEHRDDQQALRREFKDNWIYDGTVDEFADFLREGVKQFKKKGRKK